jgi:hypothetical protein
MNEAEYRDIPGFPGYRVGSDGSVLSFHPRKSDGGHWKRLKGRPNKSAPYPPKKGWYLGVVLSNAAGKRVAKLVHVLVLEAFVSPRPAGMYACHANGDPADNRLENLRWDTHAANTEDARQHGTLPIGSRKAMSKLTEPDVVEIVRLFKSGVSKSALARRYAVSNSTIRQIFTGRTWSHVNTDHA